MEKISWFNQVYFYFPSMFFNLNTFLLIFTVWLWRHIMPEPRIILWSYKLLESETRRRETIMLMHALWISGHGVWLCCGETNLLMSEDLLISLFSVSILFCLLFILLFQVCSLVFNDAVQWCQYQIAVCAEGGASLMAPVTQKRTDATNGIFKWVWGVVFLKLFTL